MTKVYRILQWIFWNYLVSPGQGDSGSWDFSTTPPFKSRWHPHPYSHRLKNGAVLVAPFWSFVCVVREVVHGNKSTRFKTQITTTFVDMKLSALCLAGFAAGAFGKCISNKPCSGKCVSAVGEVGEAFCSSYLSLAPATETVTQTATVTAVQTHLETSFEVVTLTTLTTTVYVLSPSHAHALFLAANAEISQRRTGHNHLRQA